MADEHSHADQPDPAHSSEQPSGSASVKSPAHQETEFSGESREDEIEVGRAAAILSYLPFGCFVALVRFRDNDFARRHGIQGLMLTFFEVLAGLFLIPRISEYFWVTVVFACLASTVMGVYYALQGREWTVPFVGQWFADRFDLDAAIPPSFGNDDVER